MRQRGTQFRRRFYSYVFQVKDVEEEVARLECLQNIINTSTISVFIRNQFVN